MRTAISVNRRTRIDHLDAEALTRLLGQLGHEVGTPLGSVLMMAEMLTEAQDAGTARRHGPGLATAAREIRDLVQAVVRLVRLRTGWLGPAHADVDGTDLVHRLRDAAGSVAVVGMPPSLVTDADYLADAVSLGCQWAAGRGEGATLTLASNRDGGLVVDLRSPGQDVPWDDPGVLDPLATGDLVSARRHGGAALQLAVARMLVWRLGGSLTASGEDGLAVLRIELPGSSGDPLA